MWLTVIFQLRNKALTQFQHLNQFEWHTCTQITNIYYIIYSTTKTSCSTGKSALTFTLSLLEHWLTELHILKCFAADYKVKCGMQPRQFCNTFNICHHRHTHTYTRIQDYASFINIIVCLLICCCCCCVMPRKSVISTIIPWQRSTAKAALTHAPILSTPTISNQSQSQSQSQAKANVEWHTG